MGLRRESILTSTVLPGGALLYGPAGPCAPEPGGSVGNVGVMALPVWHEEAVLDPELLPLSYADSIPSASSRLASIALRAVSLSSASLSGVGGRDGFLSFESSAILSSEK